jgi:hypothetical protein
MPGRSPVVVTRYLDKGIRREDGIGGQHGCRPGAASPQVMHIHGCAQAAVRALAGFHVSRMPECKK